MTLDTFFEKFDLFADAPDAVAKMRRFILDLAVQGKLVAQDPKDEPADELLKRVQAEKARLVKSGEIKKQQQLPPVSEDAIPFSVPGGWAASQLGDVAVCLDYMREPINGTERDVRIAGKTQDELFPYYGATQQQGWIDDFIFDAELVLLGEDGVPFFDPLRSKAYLISGKTWVNNHAHVFRGILVSNPYLMHWLNVFDYTGRVAGSTRSKLNQAKAVDIPIALPPLAEQKRIVAKVDELMALCDRLEAQQQEREAKASQLARASLARFADAPTPANLDYLFHSSFRIPPSDLRKSILTLAVQGKLVPQDPNDEPAEQAICRVPPLPRPARYDKRSIANIQGIAALSVGPTDKEIPVGWACVPLIQIARLESGHTPSRSRPDWWGGDVSWVGVVDARLHDGETIFETLQHTNEEGLANSAARLLPAGTVCVSRTASVGYVIILGKPMATSQDFVNWVPSEAVTSEWLQLVFTSETDAFNRFSKGAVHQTIYYPEWLSMHTMLPPLSEQRRIVAKVEQLMALVDALETQLAASRTTAANLLSALVAELTVKGAECHE